LNAYLSYHNVYGNAVNSTSGDGGGAGGGGSSSSSSQSSSSTSTSESSSSSATASAYRLSKIFLRPHHFQTNDTGGDVGVFPNDTIGRTLLADPNYVQLEGNGSRAQVLAWARESPGGDINILNQAYVLLSFSLSP
jgi:hypothetical protein